MIQKNQYLTIAALAVLTGTTFICTPSIAESWTTFRGPTRDGIADSKADPPIEWSENKNIRFRTELPGEGWSTPVLADGRVYMSAAIEIAGGSKKNKLFKLCLLVVDANSGKLLATHRLFDEMGGPKPHKIHSKNSHASSSAIVDGKRVFVHFGYQGTCCVDLDGNLIWSNRDLYYKPVHGNGSTPILVDNRLIFTCDGATDPKIVALDADTGKLVWERPRNVDTKKKFAFCTPAMVNVNGKKQVISPAADIVMSLAPDTGKVIWKLSYTGYSVVPKPIFYRGNVILSTSFDSPSMLSIDPRGSGDVTDTHLNWEVDKNAPHTPSMVAVDGLIYSVSDRGIAMCVEADSGDVVYKKRVGGNFSALPVLAGKRIYYTDEAGKTTVVKIGRDYEVLAENDLGERTLASPAIVGNAIFVRTAKALYRIER